MYVDAVTTAALADELSGQLLDARVQDVIEVDHDTLGFEFYAGQRRYLIMCIHPRFARCHVVAEKLRRGVETPSPMLLLLRKYVEGARLVSVTQPPWERILHFDFSHPEGDTRLVVEMIDKRSNILLIADGRILECLKRVGADQNRYRIMLPGKPYISPPSQEKLLPERVVPADLEKLFAGDPDAPAWRLLVSSIMGISPLLAREIIYRASHDVISPAYDVAGQVVYDSLLSLVSDVHRRRWSPCVVPSSEGDGYTAFAAYPLTHLADSEPRPTISAAMCDYFGAPVGPQAYGARKAHIQDQLANASDRIQRKLAALERQARQAEEIEQLRKKGELLFAYAATLSPRQTSFEAQYDPDDLPLVIPLDPNLTGVENARRYFDRYEKAKRANADVPAPQAAARQELAYLDQLRTDLELAERWPEIEAVRDALQSGGYWRGPRVRSPKGSQPAIQRLHIDSFAILVGRSAAHNQKLITENAAGSDLWLHARGVPGGHVLIRNDGRSIPEIVIEAAAGFAAYYSAARAESLVEVDVTQRRYVRPIKGGKPGMVTYKNERTLKVVPRRPAPSK